MDVRKPHFCRDECRDSKGYGAWNSGQGDAGAEPADYRLCQSHPEQKPGDWCRFCRAKAVCRSTPYGNIGDCYPAQSGIIGKIQHLIDRVFEELSKAENLTCCFLIATPHCAGKYPYVDADGYDEYPDGTGQNMESLSNTIASVARVNNVPVCDLWHDSGINRYTWSVFGAQPLAVNEKYTKYQLDSAGNQVGTTPLRYMNGQSYYQKRDGSVVLEKYTGTSPYPFNGDQLHCNPTGYARIGECVVGAVIHAFGK